MSCVESGMNVKFGSFKPLEMKDASEDDERNRTSVAVVGCVGKSTRDIQKGVVENERWTEAARSNDHAARVGDVRH